MRVTRNQDCIFRATFLAGALLAACGGDTDAGDDGPPSSVTGSSAGYATLPADVSAKLKECKIADLKALAVREEIEDESDACVGRCIVRSPCADLKEAVCEARGVGSFLACLESCPLEPKDGFACNDGSKIPHALVCDTAPDCGDGKDEDDCPPYTCRDGQKLTGKLDVECDDRKDCQDGSDEEGCSPLCE